MASHGGPGILLPGRHYPHEVFLLAVSAVIGVAYLIGSPSPTSLAMLIPHWVFVVWAGGLAVSGTAGMVGCYWPRRLDVALELERGALVMQIGVLLLYTTVLLSFAGLLALLSASINIAWAGAHIRRVWMITTGLRRTRPVSLIKPAADKPPTDGS